MRQTKAASSLVNFRAHYKIVGLYFFYNAANLHFEECGTESLPFVDQLKEVNLGVSVRHVQVLVVQFHDILIQTKLRRH